MRLTAIRLIFASLALAGLTVGCDSNGATDAGTDAGSVDAGPCARLDPDVRPDPICVSCPTTDTPAPDEQMGTCCWRHSNAESTTPEMRLTYLQIVAPEGSPLTSTVLTRTLAESMQQEHFNWLFRVDSTTEGPVNIITGFGRRQTDGTYAFSTGSGEGDPDTWCPVTMTATLSGDTVMSQPTDTVITVPVFDTTGESLQLELALRQVQIDDATWGEERSCVGWRTGNYRYHTDAQLSGYIEVAGARTGMINVPGVMTTVCAAIAGSLADPEYCDQDQSTWTVKPDSLCDDTGCRVNAAGATDVCNPATTCNAWHLVAQFAAAGVDITNGLCAAP